MIVHKLHPGQLFTWGSGNYGQLGHGTSQDQYVPTLVTSLVQYKVVDVACGTCCEETDGAHTLALTDDGQVSMFEKLQIVFKRYRLKKC